jgi:hypothetical protein
MCMPPNKAPPNLTEEAIRATKGGQLKVILRLCNAAALEFPVRLLAVWAMANVREP